MPDFRRLKNEVENGLLQVRRTPTKIAISGSYNSKMEERVEIIKKRTGFYLKWSGHIEIESEETKLCDLDHFHRVVKKERWIWNYCELSPADVKAMVDFLSERE